VADDSETYLKRLSVADVWPMIGSLSQIVKITSVIGRKLQEVSSLLDQMCYFFTLYLCLGIGKKGNRRVGEKF